MPNETFCLLAYWATMNANLHVLGTWATDSSIPAVRFLYLVLLYGVLFGTHLRSVFRTIDNTAETVAWWNIIARFLNFFCFGVPWSYLLFHINATWHEIPYINKMVSSIPKKTEQFNTLSLFDHAVSVCFLFFFCPDDHMFVCIFTEHCWLMIWWRFPM